MNIKKGDNVKILSGDDKGKVAKVSEVYPKEGKILVDGVNTVKRHEKSRRGDGKGQIVEKAMPIHVSKAKKVEN